ncbi:hypothetical protein DPEC_G00139940 [Dallia pectoralis]|uniref:Uncharacterized protein n=1 Tax=Dallia pectoralis TaxID=75939 RepID=A0ACC2GMD0_DALPE|nr:hypothetical protein DPEC_G00139940 [Dallia pectoralis]
MVNERDTGAEGSVMEGHSVIAPQAPDQSAHTHAVKSLTPPAAHVYVCVRLEGPVSRTPNSPRPSPPNLLTDTVSSLQGTYISGRDHPNSLSLFGLSGQFSQSTMESSPAWPISLENSAEWPGSW